jgi:hypothetical protein
VKNVMGRTMRARDPRAVVEWLRAAHDEHGIRNVLIVDDDLYRSPAWEPLLAGMAALRRSGRDLWDDRRHLAPAQPGAAPSGLGCRGRAVLPRLKFPGAGLPTGRSGRRRTSPATGVGARRLQSGQAPGGSGARW